MTRRCEAGRGPLATMGLMAHLVVQGQEVR
jgi:hypothetical protein